MPLLLILLAAGVFLYLWLTRRNSTLTRLCRWRQIGPDDWRCAACGATAGGPEPNHCLNPQRMTS